MDTSIIFNNLDLLATTSQKLPESFFNRIIFLIQVYGIDFLKGAGTTMAIAIVGTAVGCLIGLVCGILKTIPVTKRDNIVKRIVLKSISVLITIYVEIFRGTPMIVQAMVIFYGSYYFNAPMGMWFAAFFIVSINTGAYMAETVRGGIESIDIGQTEGARAIGMNHYQTMVFVILPQALRNIMPQIGNNLIINIKDTSVLSVIGTIELFYNTKQIAGTYYTYFEAFTVTMVVYLVLTVTCSFILRKIEHSMDGPSGYDLATKDTLTHTSGMISYHKKKAP